MQPGCRRAGCLVLVNGLVVGLILVLVLLFYPLTRNFSAIRADAYAFDPSLVPRFRPNLENEPYLHTKAGRDPMYETILISTNSAGFRDRERSLEPPPGTLRVAFVGDSFVFGLDLKDDETLPRQLEDELARRGGVGGRTVEVLNFGLPGVNFEGMGRVTQLVVSAYRPELVLYSFISDDVSRTDVIALHEWLAPMEPWLRRLPPRLADFVRDDVLVRYKMVRYDLDYRVFTRFPSLYRERIAVVADYLSGLAASGGWKMAVVDFSSFPVARQGFEDYLAEHASSGRPPFRLVTGFEVELNGRNHHPTAASQHRLALLLADVIGELFPGSPSPPGAPTPPAP